MRKTLLAMRKAFLTLGLFAAIGLPLNARGQGCSMCRDATAGSAPQARKAFRRAIPLLGFPAVGIFAGVLLLARKMEPGKQADGDESPSNCVL
jgi:hypothetical protein